MQIIGHGIDLVETARVARLLDQHGQRFLARCFTPAEVEYACAKKRVVEHLAARFAAKEAILKALGTGWRDGIAWTDMEVRRHPSGQPTVHLTGRCREIERQLGIGRWVVSLTHTRNYAAASVIASAGDPA